MGAVPKSYLRAGHLHHQPSDFQAIVSIHISQVRLCIWGRARTGCRCFSKSPMLLASKAVRTLFNRRGHQFPSEFKRI